jgi:CheY-like chemotaxis protein
MAISVVPPIVPQGISSQQSPHDRRDRYGPCSEKKVKVVGDQCPCIADGLCISENASQALQKIIPVGIVAKYRAPFNASDHDMVNGSGSVDSGFPRHETPLSAYPMVCQLKNLTVSPFTEKEKIRASGFEYRGLTLFIPLFLPSKVDLCLSERMEEIDHKLSARIGFLVMQEGRPFRVMLVEDDENFRHILAELLKECFPNVVLSGTGDGAEAMEQLKSVAPQMIFMDVKLPGQSGLELTRKIKILYPNIEVVIFTSYDFPEYRELARAFGAQWFLSKGTSAVGEIQTVVKSVWARTKASRTQCEWKRKEDENGIRPS